MKLEMQLKVEENQQILETPTTKILLDLEKWKAALTLIRGCTASDQSKKREVDN